MEASCTLKRFLDPALPGDNPSRVREENDTPFGSQYEDTSMAVRVAVGGQAHGLAIFPGVEYIVANTEFAEGNMPIDIGVLAEGYIGIGSEMQFGAEFLPPVTSGSGALTWKSLKTSISFSELASAS